MTTTFSRTETKHSSLRLTLLLASALLLSGCTPEASRCSRPDYFCVGLVTQAGRRDDHAYNQAAWEALQQARAEGQADWIASIETVDARDYGENIGVFVDAGYDLIVTVGSDMGEATRSLAAKYPYLYFVGVDQAQPAGGTLPNLAGIVFPEDQLGFLAGALAAMMTRSGRVGAVLVSDAWPPARLYGDGFRAGTAYISPQVEATVVYHDEVSLDKTFSDPAWGAAQSDALLDAGADVIFAAEGTTGAQALLTAARRRASVIGTDVDQFYASPGAAPELLTSTLKLVTPAVAGLIGVARQSQAREGLFPSGDYEGQVGLAPYHETAPTIPPKVMKRLSDLSQALSLGEVQTGLSNSNP